MIEIVAFLVLACLRQHQSLLAAFDLPQPADPRLSRRLQSDSATPNPFTGFDRGRQPWPMHDTLGPREARSGRRYPFHVVNIALNVVARTTSPGRNARRCRSTMTPLHCGNRGRQARLPTTRRIYGGPPARRHHARHRGGDLGRGGQPQHGLSLLADGGAAHDAVQRAARLVARQSGQAGRALTVREGPRLGIRPHVRGDCSA